MRTLATAPSSSASGSERGRRRRWCRRSRGRTPKRGSMPRPSSQRYGDEQALPVEHLARTRPGSWGTLACGERPRERRGGRPDASTSPASTSPRAFRRRVPAEPRLHDRRNVVGPVHRRRSSGVHEHHGAGTGRRHRPHQLGLSTGQAHVGAVVALVSQPSLVPTTTMATSHSAAALTARCEGIGGKGRLAAQVYVSPEGEHPLHGRWHDQLDAKVAPPTLGQLYLCLRRTGVCCVDVSWTVDDELVAQEQPEAAEARRSRRVTPSGTRLEAGARGPPTTRRCRWRRPQHAAPGDLGVDDLAGTRTLPATSSMLTPGPPSIVVVDRTSRWGSTLLMQHPGSWHTSASRAGRRPSSALTALYGAPMRSNRRGCERVGVRADDGDRAEAVDGQGQHRRTVDGRVVEQEIAPRGCRRRRRGAWASRRLARERPRRAVSGSPVRHDQAVEAPLVAHDGGERLGVLAAPRAPELVVGAMTAHGPASATATLRGRDRARAGRARAPLTTS